MKNLETSLIELLKHYKPADEMDAKQAARVLRFVELNNKECFNRAFLPGHITGSAWVVDSTGTRVLLTHHKKLNMWLQLGGHADGDPDVLNVARREAREESGIENLTPVSDQIFDVDVHVIPPYGSDPSHYHYDVRFALQAPAGAEPVRSDESNEVAWVDINSLSSPTTEKSLQRMARKWKNKWK